MINKEIYDVLVIGMGPAGMAVGVHRLGKSSAAPAA